jgi:hypothetical protein
MSVHIEWSKTADQMLRRRDRFTQQSVKDEFTARVTTGEISDRQELVDETKGGDLGVLDSVKRAYVMPVLDGRFSVVWKEIVGLPVQVEAVLPTARFLFERLDSKDLKRRVDKIVQAEVAELIP